MAGAGGILRAVCDANIPFVRARNDQIAIFGTDEILPAARRPINPVRKTISTNFPATILRDSPTITLHCILTWMDDECTLACATHLAGVAHLTGVCI
eukprot:9280251-Pyramimonas_sp.AAC.1